MTRPFAWLLALLGFRTSYASEFGVFITAPRWLERRFGQGVTVEVTVTPTARAFPQYAQIYRPWD